MKRTFSTSITKEGPPSVAELNQIQQHVEVNDNDGAFRIVFPSRMTFERRFEILAFITSYVKNVAAEFAVQAGLAPIQADRRLIEQLHGEMS